MATVRRTIKKARKLAASQARRAAATPKLYLCGLDQKWVQIREATTPPAVTTTKTKIKGKMREGYEDANGIFRTRQVLREQDITVSVFTGGKVLAMVPYRSLYSLGLTAGQGMAIEVPAALVPRVKKGCEYERSLLEGE